MRSEHTVTIHRRHRNPLSPNSILSSLPVTRCSNQPQDFTRADTRAKPNKNPLFQDREI
jgi:hypothetical protein